MIIIPKFQNSGKTPTRQQIEENKRKQEFLNQNGIKVKIDGSWGPWQQGWYNKIKAKQTEPKQNWFTRSTIGAAMAENPAVMTASGWQQNKQGNYVQKRTKGSDQLASNLETIGTTAITAPTLAQDITGIYNIVRHPVQTGKTIYTTGKDIYNYGRDMYTYGKDLVQLSKVAQIAPKTVKQKYVAPYISSKMLNRSINANPKGQIIVSGSYFNSPNNWYRITNTPEVYGIQEVGKNVTTRDSGVLIDVPSDNWRSSVLDLPLIRDKQGFLALDPNRNSGIYRFRLFQKKGSAHGNTSQASKGQIWKLGVSNSSMFPTVILEGQAARQVPMGINRTTFKLTPWEDIPIGQRIGFHTGEMPIDNLGYFQKLENGKYSYQGTIIPDRRINVENY